jgi:capsular polysaccharide biosynthesis protein
VNFTAPIQTQATFTPERIYISRALAQRRHVANESALMAALAERGFTSVQLERLSWAEQITLFRGAKIVVAPHGAGLANLIFSRPGTRVIECFSHNYVNSCFAQLAEACGLDYTPLVVPEEGPWGKNPKSNRHDFTIEIEALRALLNRG